MTPADVDGAQQVQIRAFTDLDVRKGRPEDPVTEGRLAFTRARIAHLQQTDPASAWVAEVDGQVVGCALALVRDGSWFLSLLVVDPAHQGRGIGAQLLDAALTTSTDRSWILATVDPAALRRYRRAGFDLHPSFTAKGRPDLALARTDGVRPGDFTADAALVDAVTSAVRGARTRSDLTVPAATGRELFVHEQGFVITRPGGVVWLGATTEQAAAALLWTALEQAGEQVEVDWLTAQQQWAVDVCLDARLSLGAGATVCLRGQRLAGPYLPSGAFG